VKAFVLDRYGKKGALRSAEMPSPDPRDDEVLVQVHAAGVNLLDDRAAAELGIRRKARSRGVDFSFLFMKANGDQLRAITRPSMPGSSAP